MTEERKTVREKVDTLTYELDGPIDTIIAYLQTLAEQYPNPVLSYEDVGDYGDSRYVIALYVTRPETDEEMAKRLVIEATNRKYAEDRLRMQYEELKKRFEPS